MRNGSLLSSVGSHTVTKDLCLKDADRNYRDIVTPTPVEGVSQHSGNIIMGEFSHNLFNFVVLN